MVSKTLDEAKDNTKKPMEEARRDISAHTASFNEYQEQSITRRKGHCRKLSGISEGDSQFTAIIVGAIYRKHVRDVLDKLDVSKKDDRGICKGGKKRFRQYNSRNSGGK
jgi:hypothetical protein